MGDRMGSEVIP